MTRNAAAWQVGWSANSPARRCAKRLNRERAARGWTPPGIHDQGSLEELFKREKPKIPFLVDQLQGRRHNVGLTGQYKVGKTTTVGTYTATLVNGLPFLGRETHLPDGRNVAWWNFEMDLDDLIDYLRPLEIRSTGRLRVVQLRGVRLPLLGQPAYDWAKQWLITNEIEVLIADSWRRLCSSCGVSENKNDEVELLTERIDQLKREAGVAAGLFTAHTPREKLEEGQERARGATAFDDWVDVRWVQTRQGHDRFLTIEGRNVESRERRLAYDPTTRRVDTAGDAADRRERRTTVLDEHVVRIVSAHQLGGPAECLSRNRLLEILRTADDVPSKNTPDLTAAIGRAEANGHIHWVEGDNRAHCYRPGRRPASG